MRDGPSHPLSGGRVRERLTSTGDPAPSVTLALTLGWVVLAAFTLVPVVLGGSVAGAIGMFGLAVPLILLPGLFASWHGRAAAWSRLTGVLVMLIATIALGVQLSA